MHSRPVQEIVAAVTNVLFNKIEIGCMKETLLLLGNFSTGVTTLTP
jgi:hypothetical protein